mmetsp:Transcript_71163/g.196511  ORF Transcript_71163/g.196511 Transcript_71163/m.196511 type:complete len:132 (-) Transcript_71163:17-412(-)
MSDEGLGGAAVEAGLGDIHAVEDEAGISTSSLISRVKEAGGSASLGRPFLFDKNDLSSTTVWGMQQQASILIMDASSVLLMARMESCKGSNASAMSVNTISAVRSDGPCGSMDPERPEVKQRAGILEATVS